MSKIVFCLSILLVWSSCKKNPEPTTTDSHLREESSWAHLDLKQDSVPGISLDLAYEHLIIENKGTEIIVAVMDSQIDIHHEDIKYQIYTNFNEIPNNKIDDDNNGYVDDVHGWNFLGYGKYKYERYLSFVHVRVIQALAQRFEGKTINDIDERNLKDFKKYLSAIEKYKKVASKEKRYLEIDKEVREEFYDIIKTFADRIPGHENYTRAQLDTLEIRNKEEEKLVEIMKKNIVWGYTFEYTYKDQENTLIDIYTLNNLKYNERANIGDDPYDFETIGYGNGYVDAPSHIFHGTEMAGLIAATRNNGLGIRGISNNIKIMPLVVEPEYGHYNDKDLANAVRYAVDNGARIINFSGGKEYTENEELLFSALKYAENKGVLFVTSAGNDGANLDLPENTMYFMDVFDNRDSVSNVIQVGSTTKFLGDKLLSSFSNYGQQSVDLFVPGEDIKSTDPRMPRYVKNSGTSMSAAITSGVAALILSHYPNLSHKQLKHILMESGTPYDFVVATMDNDSIPFRDLSKSGKVLNAYNALKMAEEISKKKN